jgi:hypothetical protein
MGVKIGISVLAKRRVDFWGLRRRAIFRVVLHRMPWCGRSNGQYHGIANFLDSKFTFLNKALANYME